MDIIWYVLCVIWLSVLLYLGITMIIVKYKCRKLESSINAALQRWAVNCIYACDFDKAHTIQKIIDKDMSYNEFVREAYALVLADFLMAQELFKSARGVDNTTSAIAFMALTEKRFDKIHKELKKLY